MSILQGLHDKELPVRVDSVVALRNFVDASQGEQFPPSKVATVADYNKQDVG